MTTTDSPQKMIVAPSILACDFGHAADECKDVLSKGADWLHCDVMDGHFVPNISLGAPVVASIRKSLPEAFLDCHLMVSEPKKWVDDFAKAGANQYTFHVECFNNNNNDNDNEHAQKEQQQEMLEFCKEIRDKGMRVGITVKPKTPVESVFAAIEAGVVDMILIMTVEPGFGGQSFMSDMMPKVEILRKMYPQLDIQVDGGIDLKTAPIAAKAGANVFVAGTAIFKAADRSAVISGIHHSK